MKKCSKCGEIKKLAEFSKNKRSNDGYNYSCKKCSLRYYTQNKDAILLQKKEYIANNREKIKKTQHNKYENRKCTTDFKEKQIKYYKKNKHKILKKSKKYHEKTKLYRSTKEYKDKKNEYNREYYKNRIKHDNIYRLKILLRRRVRQVLISKGINTAAKTMDLIGCTAEEAKIHIEKQFTKGMTWENYGFYGWHIDHRVPLASANSVEELKELFHFSNLQPMWAKDNMSKGSKEIFLI